MTQHIHSHVEIFTTAFLCAEEDALQGEHCDVWHPRIKEEGSANMNQQDQFVSIFFGCKQDLKGSATDWRKSQLLLLTSDS